MNYSDYRKWVVAIIAAFLMKSPVSNNVFHSKILGMNNIYIKVLENRTESHNLTTTQEINYTEGNVIDINITFINFYSLCG